MSDNVTLSLSDFALENEAQYEIRNKRGERSGWTWTMAGPGHPATVAADEKQLKRALTRQEEQERARVNGRKWKGGDESPEELQERQASYIVARLLRWSDITDGDGNPFACTPENARKVLMNPGLNVFEQIDAFLRDERSFTQPSAKS